MVFSSKNRPENKEFVGANRIRPEISRIVNNGRSRRKLVVHSGGCRANATRPYGHRIAKTKIPRKNGGSL
jgi:hypothetical protein